MSGQSFPRASISWNRARHFRLPSRYAEPRPVQGSVLLVVGYSTTTMSPSLSASVLINPSFRRSSPPGSGAGRCGRDSAGPTSRLLLGHATVRPIGRRGASWRLSRRVTNEASKRYQSWLESDRLQDAPRLLLSWSAEQCDTVSRWGRGARFASSRYRSKRVPRFRSLCELAWTSLPPPLSCGVVLGRRTPTDGLDTLASLSGVEVIELKTGVELEHAPVNPQCGFVVTIGLVHVPQQDQCG